MTSRRWSVAGLILLALLTVLVFVPGLSDEFTWDDNGLIRTNEHIQRPEHYREALTTHFWNVSESATESNETYSHLYRPLVTLAYIVQYRLFGLHAVGYRVVNLALHVLCCMLAFFWLARRLPTGTETQRLFAIGLGTAVFALHPSRVEAVSWISGSTDLWMCALVLLAALAFDSNRNWLAGILIALALFAKESAIVAAPLLLADRFLLRGDRDRRASVALIAPVVAALMVRVWVVDLDLPSADARAAAPRVLASLGLYLQQVAAPWNPTAFPGMRIYSCDAAESLAASWLIMGTLLVGATTAVGIIAFRRKEWRPAFADLLWFVVPLLPVVNLLDLGSRNLTADRFLYLPMLGVVALLARGMLWLLAKRPAIGKASAITIAVFVLGFAVVTSLHSRVFASSSSFWEYEARRNTENPFALHAVGTARTLAGLRDTGLGFLERAQRVAERTCVHSDQVRAAADLGWAHSLRTGPNDRAKLMRMRSAYAQVPSTGLFAYEGPSGWSVQLTPEEADDLASDELRYILPRATIEARLGNIDEAVEIVEGTGGGERHARTSSLRLRLLAAQGRDQQALIESVEHDSVADIESLMSLLATADETLAHAHIPSERRGSLIAYALGFGQAPDELDSLSPRDTAILVAVRAYSSGEPVDIEGIQVFADDSNELPQFIGLAHASSSLRRLDSQLRSTDSVR